MERYYLGNGTGIVSSMNKASFGFVLLGLVAGIFIGWFSRPYLSQAEVMRGESMRAESITRSISNKDSSGGLAQGDALSQESVLSWASAQQKTGANSPENAVEVMMLRLIEQQNVEAFLDELKASGLDLAENSTLYRQFVDNLYQLYQQNNERLLGLWIGRMLESGYDYSILYAMAAKLKLLQSDRLSALVSLFLARHYSVSSEEVDLIQVDIENVVIDMMNLYRENSLNVSQKTALSVMQLAMEKQPDNPLFGVEISILYADAGDIDRALETLNLIPYSEKYQGTIVTLKTKWLNAKNASEKVTTAIPLKQVGQHFHVTAIVNQQRTLDLMIDTGATTTALSREAVDFLRAANILSVKEGTVSIATANGNANVDYYRVGLFAIGEYAVENFDLLEVEISESGSFDGLLGMNFLSLFEFEIDQTNRQLFLTTRE